MRTTRRTVAVGGALVAAGATALMGLAVGTASAEVPGRCLDNVYVRAQPSIDAQIVAICEAGTAVLTDGVRDGFVQLTDLGGWAVGEYIEVGGRPAGAPGSAPVTGTPADGDDGSADAGVGDADDAPVTTPADEADATTSGPAVPGEPTELGLPGPVAGLL